METVINEFYVATESEIFNPIIVEKFSDRADANSYAILMSRTKGAKSI